MSGGGVFPRLREWAASPTRQAFVEGWHIDADETLRTLVFWSDSGEGFVLGDVPDCLWTVHTSLGWIPDAAQVPRALDVLNRCCHEHAPGGGAWVVTPDTRQVRYKMEHVYDAADAPRVDTVVYYLGLARQEYLAGLHALWDAEVAMDNSPPGAWADDTTSSSVTTNGGS